MSYDPPATAAVLLDGERGDSTVVHRPRALGFDPLDKVLGGGLRGGDLALLGGAPGVGKTAVLLQWARRLATDGHTPVVVCYEHDQVSLLQRLLMQIVGELAGPNDAGTINAAREAALDVAAGGPVPPEAARLLEPAIEQLRAIGDRLWLVRGSGVHTDLDALNGMLSEVTSPVLLLDYLQKVAMRPEPTDEHEKLVRVVSGLKELALTHEAPVVAIGACDQAALEGRRARLHHLRGSSSLAYEADIAMMLNPKTSAISEVHLAYDAVRAESFRKMVVLSIEKNRNGPAGIDLEFAGELDRFRLNPEGGFVAERMAT